MSAPILTLQLPAIKAVPLAEQLPVGRLVEIARVPSGAQMTLAVACVRQAMAQGSPVGWVQSESGALFPPDLAESGVDLDALLVVHVPQRVLHNGLAKSAELLLRSGGFGLVVIDLNDCESESDGREPTLPLPVQSRLLGLAREHASSVLLLSAGGSRSGSLGPLVSLCIEPHRRRRSNVRGEFELAPRARKDKSGSLCALATESRRGPWGLW